jgi:hypothetical protein
MLGNVNRRIAIQASQNRKGDSVTKITRDKRSGGMDQKKG